MLDTLARFTDAEIPAPAAQVPAIRAFAADWATRLPELAKWLPTGAAVGLTVPANPGQDVLSPGVALLVLLGWTALISIAATAVNARRELR